MTASYSAQYIDKFGTESISIFNDGKILKMTLRGIEFTGSNFHSFSISPVVDDAQRVLFNLFVDDLCGYSIDCQIPVWLIDNEGGSQALLHAHIEYGEPVDGHTSFHYQDGTRLEINQQIDIETLKLEIEYQGKTYQSGGKNLYNSFDEQLSELRDSFPPDVYLKTCWNCAFSDYHPAGSGIFGDLACFRNTKSEYRQVKDKRALMYLWSQRAEDVQEVHLCPEFEKREPGVGGLYVG
jgi:hypothetical protein